MKAKKMFVLLTLVGLLTQLILSCSTIIPAKADDDQVTININMSGDANITITNTNGSILIIYNGVDIIKTLATKTEVNSLWATLFNVMSTLDVTFKDLYGKVNFLAYVTGVNTHDNSTIALTLKAGKATLVDFLNDIYKILDDYNVKLTQLRVELSSFEDQTIAKINELYQEVVNNKAYFERRLQALQNHVDEVQTALETEIQVTKSDITNLGNKINAIYNGFLTTIAVIGVLNIALVLLIIYVAKWKAEKITDK